MRGLIPLNVSPPRDEIINLSPRRPVLIRDYTPPETSRFRETPRCRAIPVTDGEVYHARRSEIYVFI